METPPCAQQQLGADAADVLFLIVKHLRHCGLSASAMALLRESEVDTAWLCGPSREMKLLREWVFAGDFACAKTLLQPLAGALTDEELSDALAVIDKQELLESLHPSGDGEPLPHRGAGQWNVNEARMQCFEKLVPFFRGDIEPEEDEHKYLVMKSTQLMALVHDGVTYNSERAVASGEMASLDCISMTSESHRSVLDQLERPSRLRLFLAEKQVVASAKAPPTSHLLSRSADWSRLKGKWTNTTTADDLNELVDSTSCSSKKRRNQLAISLDFDKARLAMRRPQQTKANELVVEEEQDEDTDSDEGEAPAPPPATLEDERKQQLAVKVLCDSATQTDTAISHHVPLLAPADPSTAPETRNAEAHDDTEPLPPTVIDNNATLGSHSPVVPESRQPEASLAGLKGEELRSLELGVHGSPHKRTSRPDLLATSFTSDASRSVCIDDDDELFATVPENRSPISKYLGEEEEDQLEDADQQEQGPQTNDRLSDLQEQDSHQEERRPERYDQLTLDHIVRASVIAEVKEAHAVRAIDLNASGSQLAIGTNARALRVFDLVSPLASASLTSSSMTMTKSSRSSCLTPQHSFLPLLPVLIERHKHHQTSIYCVAFNNVNSTRSPGVIASGDADSCIKVLSLATQKEVSIQSHRGKIRGLHFAADNLLWSTATGDLRIRCWDLSHSSSSSCMDLDGHVGEIQALAFAQASSPHLLSASLDKTIRLWDHRSGKCERIVASHLVHPAFTLQFDPTNHSRYFASGHQDGSVGLWDLRMKGRPLQSLAHHQDECRAVSWSPDGAWLLSSSFDGTICLMQASVGADKPLAPMASYHQHQDKVLQTQWHPTQPAIVTTGADKVVKLWAFA